MNAILINLVKKTQVLVLSLFKKAEVLRIGVSKKKESFLFKIYSNLNQPPYILKRYAYMTVEATEAYNRTARINKISALDGETVTVDWGDGTIQQLTGDNTNVNHVYADTGQYTIKFRNPDKIKIFGIDGDSGYDKFTITSKDLLIPMVNIERLELYYPSYGYFNSSHIRHLRPSYFQLEYPVYGFGFVTKFNSADVADWNPDTFRLSNLGSFSGTEVIFNSSDISSWSPTVFYLHLPETPPENIQGTFNSSHVSSWTPSTFGLGYVTSVFDSSDISSWAIPTNNSFSLRNLKEGSSITIDMSDLSSMNPYSFTVSDMPSGFTFTMPTGSLSGWTSTAGFNMVNNRLSQIEVDNILKEFYEAFSNRVFTGGVISLGSTFDGGSFENASPSGFYEASASPTYGKQYAYELKNDSQNINPTKKWSIINYEDRKITYSVTSTASTGQVAELAFVKIEGGSVAVDYGDGVKTIYTSGDNITISNEYQTIDTFTAIVYNCENITKLTFRDVQDCTASFSFSDIINFRNLKYLDTIQAAGLYFDLDTGYMRNLNLDYFRHTGKNNGTTTINTSDMENWDMLTEFNLSLASPIGSVSGTFDTLDISLWNPVTFTLNNIPTGISGTFDCENISSWSSITSFQLYNLPSTIGGSMNSSSFSLWSSLNLFRLDSISGIFSGTFNMVDFQNKPLQNFGISNMPTGVTGTIDSHYFSLLSSPTSLGAVYFYNLHSGFTGNIDMGDFSLCTGMGVFEVHDNDGISFTVTADSFSSIPNLYALNVRNNNLSRADVDQILSDLWDAFPSRSLPFGTAYLDGNNFSPSGIYQPANPPTTGQEYAYELVNDTQNVSSGAWSTIYLADYAYELLSGVDASTLSSLDPQTLVVIEVVE